MMLNKSNLCPLGVVCAVLLAASLSSDSRVNSQQIPSFLNQKLQVAAQSGKIASLKDGNYQFCSQPDPQDWRDGAGVCVNFQKTAQRISGYYGYPHSDNFICVRGIVVDDDRIAGEGLAIAWGNHQLQNTSQAAEFLWDLEGRLKLSQGTILSTANDGEDAARWILYRNAALNLQGFYQYHHPRMTPISQLCQWDLK